MSTAPKKLDLSAPPIVKTIGQRALIVGIVFSLGALVLAFTRPEEFYRGYLLGYMDWLGIALGSMAIVMIRHLTGGGWGTVIRRILGAAMRTLPILAILFIGEVLAAMCFAIVAERILYDYKPMSEMLRPDFVHDHGKWTLAFIMVWAYFNFSQWLIIWAGNLPAEITFYLKRISHGWGWVAIFLVFFHFVIPFVILLSRPFKRNIRKLVWLAPGLLSMR